MMLKIKLESGGKKIEYKTLSAAVKYLLDGKKLKESFLNHETIFNVKFSELQKKNFLSEKGTELRSINHSGKPDELILCKVKAADVNPDYFRNQLSVFIQKFRNEETKYVHVFIPDYEMFKETFSSPEYYYQTFAEGILLSSYEFSAYKSDKKKTKDLTVYLYAEGARKLESAVEKAKLIIRNLNFARDLQNEPSNNLTPEIFSRRIKEYLKSEKLTIQVMTPKDLKKQKMGGILAVGGGSVNHPELITIIYSPTGAKKNKFITIYLVGKGVMFDSGGISIKPAQNMWEMKADMSGAAVCAAAINAAAQARLNLNITAVIPAVENMPSGSSFKPGDIVTTASGKSIEIDNTDAEGRVILADALHVASKEKPDMIIDIATLTGGCVVALGDFVAGLFTKNDDLAEKLIAASERTRERIWRMPMWDDYHRLNKSEVADVKNLGSRWGSAVSAAKFLENFVDKDIPWAHLDIAGPAMPNDSANYTRKYMTGFGVRLLFEFLSGLQKD